MITFRDDDISFLTDLNEFKKVHEIFNEYGCIHTIAVMTKNIHKNEPLVDYINNQINIDPQVHCYEHLDFATINDDEIRFQLQKSKDIISSIFECTPTFFYPPFNSANSNVNRISEEVGLKMIPNKMGILYFIRNHNNLNPNNDYVINFHYWDYAESILIGAALKLYNEKWR